MTRSVAISHVSMGKFFQTIALLLPSTKWVTVGVSCRLAYCAMRRIAEYNCLTICGHSLSEPCGISRFFVKWPFSASPNTSHIYYFFTITCGQCPTWDLYCTMKVCDWLHNFISRFITNLSTNSCWELLINISDRSPSLGGIEGMRTTRKCWKCFPGQPSVWMSPRISI